MSERSLLPRIPQPPHDPTSLRLGGGPGWQPLAAALRNVAFSGPDAALTLARQPGLARSLAEPNGSFGGLRPPSNVALGPGGEIYLLDRARLTLRIFDPCACAFLDAPCFGGRGAGRRELQNPGGIGICAGNLFVCDTGNRRLGVFALRGYTLRGHWSPPPNATAQPWSPVAVAFDGKGRVYVSDPANGAAHQFSSAGTWLGMRDGLGSVSHLAVDCRDRVLVVTVGGRGAEALSIDFDAPGDRRGLDLQAASGLFPPLPFAVDADGRLHLGGLCPSTEEAEPGCLAGPRAPDGAAGEQPERGVFTADGQPWQPPAGAAVKTALVYQPEGEYVSAALDSFIYRCQWHRVLLEGETVPGSFVIVSTFTSEVALPDTEVRALPPEAWQTGATARLERGAGWDCLVMSPPGRFLWLRLELRSTGMVTPRVGGAEIEFPRISLRRYLPAVFGEEPASADFTDRFLAIFDTSLRSIESKLDRLAAYFDPGSAPAGEDGAADFLDWLASWIGITLERRWPVARKRRFLKQVGALFPLRGTREGLRRQLLVYFGMDGAACCCPDDRPAGRCEAEPRNCRAPEPPRCAWQPPELILEHFQLRRWLFVGAGRPGEQAALWGEGVANRSRLDHSATVDVTQLRMTPDPVRDPFLAYAHRFTVLAPGCFGKDEANRRALQNLLTRESPAHTTFEVRYVEPRFRIGMQSTIGLDAVIGRIPEGARLDDGAGPGDAHLLGRDTVLADGAGAGGPSLRVGKTSQVGGATRLD